MMPAPDPSAFMIHTALPLLKAIWLASGDHDGLWPEARTWWGFDPSASMTQICPFFSKTILTPSGDHRGNWFVAASLVSGVEPVPSAFMTMRLNPEAPALVM